MTTIRATFLYEGSLTERESRALSGVPNVYGIWAFRIMEEAKSITVEYDATRLNADDIVALLRHAGVQVQATPAKAA